MAAASWLIGSVEGASFSVEINSSTYTFAQGNWYLKDGTASRSIADQLQTHLVTAGATNASVFFTPSGRMRITADVAFSLTWTDTALRDYMGWTANISSSTASTAGGKGQLFWSPGRPETPLSTPAGVASYPDDDTVHTASRTAKTTTATENHVRDLQEYLWKVVPSSRVWTADEDGGEFKVFREKVLRPRYRFKMYRQIDEDTSDTTTSQAIGTAIGPYKARELKPDWYGRVVPNSDALSDIELKLWLVDDYS